MNLATAKVNCNEATTDMGGGGDGDDRCRVIRKITV